MVNFCGTRGEGVMSKSWRTVIAMIIALLAVVQLGYLLTSISTMSTFENTTQLLLIQEVYKAGFEQPHPELCPQRGARLKLLILVTSAPAHAAARDAVRLTWGHFAARSDITVGFVLGALPEQLRSAVAAEDAIYGDIIVGNFVDTYTNLTLKTLSMLEWIDTYCPRAPRFLKTDDDMFINLPKLLEFISAPSRVNATRTIWGRVFHHALPVRKNVSKFYVPYYEFPGLVYPDYANGPAYLMTVDVVSDLLAAAQSELYLRIEDVFFTGVLAEKLRIKRQDAVEFYNDKVSAHPCALKNHIAIHQVRYHEQFDLWRKLLDGKSKCKSQ